MTQRSLWKWLIGSAAALFMFGCGAQASEDATLSEDEFADEADEGEEFGSIQQALGSCTAVSLTTDVASPAPGGTLVTFTATPSGCTNPRFKFDYRYFDPSTSTWSPWINLVKGKVGVAGPYSSVNLQIQMRVKVKEKGASGWETQKKKTFEWGDIEYGSCEGMCGGFSTNCYCDDVCEDFGDCCPDKQQWCGDACTEGWDCNLGTGNVGCDESCVTDPTSGLPSFCAKVVEGGQTCVGDNWCSEAQDCTASADCADGYICSPDTCCGTPKCFVAYCPAEPAEVAVVPGEGPTATQR